MEQTLHQPLPTYCEILRQLACMCRCCGRGDLLRWGENGALVDASAMAKGNVMHASRVPCTPLSPATPTGSSHHVSRPRVGRVGWHPVLLDQ